MTANGPANGRLLQQLVRVYRIYELLARTAAFALAYPLGHPRMMLLEPATPTVPNGVKVEMFHRVGT
jgi:hypothetical protein